MPDAWRSTLFVLYLLSECSIVLHWRLVNREGETFEPNSRGLQSLNQSFASASDSLFRTSTYSSKSGPSGQRPVSLPAESAWCPCTEFVDALVGFVDALADPVSFVSAAAFRPPAPRFLSSGSVQDCLEGLSGRGSVRCRASHTRRCCVCSSPQPLKEEHHRHPAATGACSCCGSHRTSNPANNDFLVAESKASFSSGGGLAARHARRLLPRTTSMPNVPDPMQTPSPSPSPSPSTHRFSRNRSVRDAEALVEDGITLFPESGAGREEDGARFDASKGAELNLKTRLALGLGEGHSRQLSAPTSLQVFNPIHPANQHAPGDLPPDPPPLQPIPSSTSLHPAPSSTRAPGSRLRLMLQRIPAREAAATTSLDTGCQGCG